MIPALQIVYLSNPQTELLAAFSYLFFPAVSSYIALQFTGSTTYTGMSGVEKELKKSIPIYFSLLIASAGLLIVYKLKEWSIL